MEQVALGAWQGTKMVLDVAGEGDVPLSESKNHLRTSTSGGLTVIGETGNFSIGAFRRTMVRRIVMTRDYKRAEQCKAAIQKSRGSYSGYGLWYTVENRRYLSPCTR